ncbi:MAG TPA: SUMF1/EgtB/PvdO family nonheme iron enzyme, partial [Candidatus Cloacimonadota bacterium]|nr:SUMF1/EgtB/PvdO family nonheme iron enzyme [Candidatus Cloacimonadota bacterium]HQB41297.1 SUMF1/EgtB/PvdO family nonheme iron enzyme [Candidatus Cloacimonadota bacterium]
STFQMGTDEVLEVAFFDEPGDMFEGAKPAHPVQVSSFYISKYAVTQSEWKDIMGKNPSNNEGDNLPVESVSWNDAVYFCNQKSLREGLTPAYTINGDDVSCDWGVNGYRLPTEAEWEYAAKGGKKSKGFKFAGSNNINEVAWYMGNSDELTHAVGAKSPNELGLYDMSGNVWEWCWDKYDEDYYKNSPKNNPMGAEKGDERVLRGGAYAFFSSEGDDCRIPVRFPAESELNFPIFGLRLARTK